MTEPQKTVTPHLTAGETAPDNLHGATFLLSTGHIAEVRDYGRAGYVLNWTGSPTDAAIFFLREIRPFNKKVQSLKVVKTVKIGGSTRTTERFYEFRFPFDGQFIMRDGYREHSPNERVYRADGSWITWTDYLKLVDAYQAEQKVKEEEVRAELARKKLAGKGQRLAYIRSMDPEHAKALLIELAAWWDPTLDEHGIRKPIRDNGGTIDALLTELTGIDDNDM